MLHWKLFCYDSVCKFLLLFNPFDIRVTIQSLVQAQRVLQWLTGARQSVSQCMQEHYMQAACMSADVKPESSNVSYSKKVSQKQRRD